MTLLENFYFMELDDLQPTPEAYKKLSEMALQARRRNPNAFDALTDWILDDSQWTEASLAENEKIIMQGVLARFKEQNAKLRALLMEMEPLDVVNEAVFKALDRFDHELSGKPHDERLREAVGKVFSDFSAMKARDVRTVVAGEKTGPAGTDTVECVGYINYLKDCDASVQWTLFMPDMVKRQQNGFTMDSFDYQKLPAIRFIGREGEDLADIGNRKNLFAVLDGMGEYKSGFDHDVLLMHHYGLGVDVGPWHGFWGRFMCADAPVPEGFVHFDFTPDHDGKAGFPFCTRFAYATFSGDPEAMHKREGYDSDAMYDVTRNVILGQGAHIPYPEKYWTAEVFLDGCDRRSTAYMFSAMIE